MPGLHGMCLALDAVCAEALGPWLGNVVSAVGETVQLRTATAKELARPEVLDVLLEESSIWLGRTATGLILCGQGQSWLAIETEPALVRGELNLPSDSAQARELVLAAVLIALRTTGVHFLHAAAVCTEDRALVLIGDSGVGKSTTATALAAAGCRYLGDDGLLIRKGSGDVELLGFFRSFRLTERVLPSFAALKPHLSKVATDAKWTLDTASAFPNRYLTRWLGPTCLLFLARSARVGSAICSLTLAEATGLLIAQSNALSLECHPNPRQHLDLLAHLASRAHIARLELGSEWLDDPLDAARRLIARSRSFSLPNQLRTEAI